MSSETITTTPEANAAPAAAAENAPRPSVTSPPAQAPRSELVAEATIENFRDLVQSCGYRVEIIRDGKLTYLRSATNGLSFDIRPGNLAPNFTSRYADMAFMTFFNVRGTLPLDLLNRWNGTRRFSRLFLEQASPDQQFLVFAFDVSMIGGVSRSHLRANLEIWDNLIQQLVPWLREELSRLSPEIDTTSSAGNPPVQAQQS